MIAIKSKIMLKGSGRIDKASIHQVGGFLQESIFGPLIASLLVASSCVKPSRALSRCSIIVSGVRDAYVLSIES
jgi:hypothetical protein